MLYLDWAKIIKSPEASITLREKHKVFILEPIADPVSEAQHYVELTENIIKNHGHLDYETQVYHSHKIYGWLATTPSS